MYYHFAYGLTIRSSIPLPEVVAVTETKPDVIIREGQVGRCPPVTISPGGYYCMTPGEAFFCWDAVGAFLVRHGQEIIVEPLSGVPEHLIRLPLFRHGVIGSAATAWHFGIACQHYYFEWWRSSLFGSQGAWKVDHRSSFLC